MPEKKLLVTPWFEVLEKISEDAPSQFVIDAPDFVVIVATNPAGHLLLVKQFRSAVEAVTLELPAGLVDPGETPEITARKELKEETGHEAGSLELLARLSPSTARFRNSMWCFFTPNARPTPEAQRHMESGMEPVVYQRGWRALLQEPGFYAAPGCAALFAALSRGKLG